MGVRVLKFLADNTKGRPNEDYLRVRVDCGGHVCVVGDGITRFVAAGKEYPNPSYAATAAKIFCDIASFSAVEGMRENLRGEGDVCAAAIGRAFMLANEDIAKFNQTLGITKETTDYLENDFYGCVGALGILTGSTLRYGYIGDCGLLIYDSKSFMPKFVTNNDTGLLENFREAWGWFKGMSNTDQAEGRKERRLFWARDLRNKPNALHLTYGALTGEPEALAYVKGGCAELAIDSTAVFFSDGILPYLFDRSVRKAIVEALGSDMGEAVRKEIVAQAISRANFTLRACNVSNLDDDKAFVALQLV